VREDLSRGCSGHRLKPARRSLLAPATRPRGDGDGHCRSGRGECHDRYLRVVFAATDRPALDPRGRLHTFCHAIPGRWHVMGVTQAADFLCAGSAISSDQERGRPRSLRTAYRGGLACATGMRQPVVDAVSNGRANATSRPAGSRSTGWSYRVSYAGARHPRHSGGRGFQPA